MDGSLSIGLLDTHRLSPGLPRSTLSGKQNGRAFSSVFMFVGSVSV